MNRRAWRVLAMALIVVAYAGVGTALAYAGQYFGHRDRLPSASACVAP